MTPEHAALVAAAAEQLRRYVEGEIMPGVAPLTAKAILKQNIRIVLASLAGPALPGATPLDEQEHVRTLHEVREYLAILCGMRHWKRLDPADARAMAQAAQVIANEFAEHFSVALDPRGEEPGGD